MRIAVVGAGIVGLATALALADAGADVDCVDAGEPMGARSAGGTRIFRLAHAEAALVDAAARARRRWADWSRRAGVPLVGDEGTVVSGERVPTWAAAMAEAGAEHRVDEPTSTTPAGLPIRPTGPVLHDPAGGVLDLAATGRFLRAAVPVRRAHVTGVDQDGTVHLDRERLRCDAVVLAAGAGTPALAAPLGVAISHGLEHHARFTFRMRAPERVPCLLDGEPHATVSRTYQHRTREGHWAIGGHPPASDTAWELGAAEAARRSREAVIALVAEHAPGLDPEPVETLTCTLDPDLGDGVHTARAGVVHVVWGENLAKLAPLISEHVARDTLGGPSAAGDAP